MVETGKRSRPQRDFGFSDDGKSQRRKSDTADKNRSGELVVYRILCPDTIIGSVIGKAGKVINSIRNETNAKIRVVDPFPGSNLRVITIYCYVNTKENISFEFNENDTDIFCSAQDALLKVHSVIANAGDSRENDKVTANLLIPGSQVANVIGKNGSLVKTLRSKTKARIKITPKDPSEPNHSCGMSWDNFVEISGDADAVKRAVHAISSIMYRFSPKEEIPLGSEVHDVAPTVIIPSDMPIYPSGGYYPSVDSIVPPRSAAPVIGATHHMEGLTGFSSDLGSAYSLYSSALPVAPGYGVSSRTEELTVKVLCPTDKIGRVIGKGGGSIKSVRQSTGARVDVEDAKDDCDECVIIVASTESNGDSRSPAVEAVLLLQGKINDNSDEDESVTMRLLVPSKVVGCLIGRGGAIITEMRKKTKADIRISKGDKPKCCASNEELVETSGEVSCVRDALVQIILRLREDVLRDKEGDQAPSEPLYSGSLSTYSSLPGGPSAAPFSYDQRHDTGSGLGMLHTGGLRGYGSLTVGENGYGSALSSYSSKPYGGLSSTSLELVIPAHAVGKVMGKGGANITNIRKISGATIEVLDGKTRNGDRLAHISGTTEQKSLAENLIQAFIMST